MSHGQRTRPALTLRAAALAGGDYSMDPHERYEAGGFPETSTMLEGRGKTLRHMAEPLQRDPGDTDPVSTAIEGGIGAVLVELDRRVAEAQAARAAEKAEASEAGPDGAADMDEAFVRSILETDPHVVLRAVAEYLRGQSA